MRGCRERASERAHARASGRASGRARAATRARFCTRSERAAATVRAGEQWQAAASSGKQRRVDTRPRVCAPRTRIVHFATALVARRQPADTLLSKGVSAAAARRPFRVRTSKLFLLFARANFLFFFLLPMQRYDLWPACHRCRRCGAVAAAARFDVPFTDELRT